MLTLTIKKKWFDMILSGEKKEEYRDIKPYYTSRFSNAVGYHLKSEVPKIMIRFRNGYSSNSPSFVAECMIYKGYGNSKWGAEDGKKYYVLAIIKVIMNEKKEEVK